MLLLDQTLLPGETREIACRDVATLWEAIRRLRVRGVPAIGLAAAYGLCLAAQEAREGSPSDLVACVGRAARYLATSRPTAVNLFSAMARMERRLADLVHSAGGGDAVQPADAHRLRVALLAEARAIHEEDCQDCRRIGQLGRPIAGRRRGGADPLQRRRTGHGRLRHGAGRVLRRPRTRPAAACLCRRDAAAVARSPADGLGVAAARHRGHADLRFDGRASDAFRIACRRSSSGADRIAANGDTANKIGTYGVAVLARAHGIPFYVAAPVSTFDLSLATGAEIPIEAARSARDHRSASAGESRPRGSMFTIRPSTSLRPS